MQKSYPLLGIAAVAFVSAMIGTAVVLSPWFSWYGNDLSDLGKTSNQLNVASGVAWIFDGGLIIGGVLTTLFCVFLAKESGFSWKYLIWSVPLALSAIDLSLIGIFNASFGIIHLIVSELFFFLTAFTLFLYAYVSFPMGTPKTGAIALFLGAFSSTVWVARLPWQGVAIQETATSAASAFLILLTSARSLIRPQLVAESVKAAA
jgi:hypothetical membrane protein